MVPWTLQKCSPPPSKSQGVRSWVSRLCIGESQVQARVQWSWTQVTRAEVSFSFSYWPEANETFMKESRVFGWGLLVLSQFIPKWTSRTVRCTGQDFAHPFAELHRSGLWETVQKGSSLRWVTQTYESPMSWVTEWNTSSRDLPFWSVLRTHAEGPLRQTCNQAPTSLSDFLLLPLALEGRTVANWNPSSSFFQEQNPFLTIAA